MTAMKIPEPRKLKSGNYFIQLRLNGQSVPVTAPTSAECRNMAQLIKAEHKAGKREIRRNEKTLGDLIDDYVVKYEPVLSASTIRGYASARKNRFPGIMEKPVSEIRNWQAVINAELKTHSEKTVKNGWGVVTAVLTDNGIRIPDVKLAKVPENELAFLEPEEIPLFLEALKGDIAEIEILLELHGLRESEAMYVVRNDQIDLKHNIIIVHGALIPNRENKYVEKKTNKTKVSTRNVPIMIPRLVELVKYHKDNGIPIPTHAPITLLRHVHSACKKANVTDVTNHGLRRTFVSLGYSVGVSEIALQKMGGWSDHATMHRIYIKLASRDKKSAENAISEFFRQKTEDDLYAEALQKLSAIKTDYASIERLKPVFEAIENLQNANEKC